MYVNYDVNGTGNLLELAGNVSVNVHKNSGLIVTIYNDTMLEYVQNMKTLEKYGYKETIVNRGLGEAFLSAEIDFEDHQLRVFSPYVESDKLEQYVRTACEKVQ